LIQPTNKTAKYKKKKKTLQDNPKSVVPKGLIDPQMGFLLEVGSR